MTILVAKVQTCLHLFTFYTESPVKDLKSIKKLLANRGTDVVSPDKTVIVSAETAKPFITEGFMANLEAEHEKVETIGFIEASALKNLVLQSSDTNQQPGSAHVTNANASTDVLPQQQTQYVFSSIFVELVYSILIV